MAKAKMKHGGKIKKYAEGGSTGGFPKTDRYGSTKHTGTAYGKGGKVK